MSLKIYPDITSDSPAAVPLQWSQSQLILSSEFETGREQRRLVWDSPRRSVSLDYKYTSLENADKIYNFYSSVNGPLESFLFFFPTGNAYVDEKVGTANGGERTIYLPSMGATDYTLRLGSIPLTPGVNYNLVPNPGPGLGSDYANMIMSVEEGDKFFWSFKGNLKIKARFDEGSIDSSVISSYWYSFSTNIIQLQHEVNSG
jgi:hypothetical protein